MFQKLYCVEKDGIKFFVLAFTFEAALKLWRESSNAFTKADPDSLALAVPTIIGAANKKDVSPAALLKDAEAQAATMTRGEALEGLGNALGLDAVGLKVG